MTLNLMREFGINYLYEDNTISIKNQKYIVKDYVVESDWSSSYFGLKLWLFVK